MRLVAKVWLSILLLVALPTAVLAAPPLDVSDQTSPVAFLGNATNEQFFGTVKCTKNADGGVRAVVTQEVALGTPVERAGELSFTCTGKQQFWLMRLPDDRNGQYTAGPATLDIGCSATRGSDGVVTGRSEPIVIYPF